MGYQIHLYLSPDGYSCEVQAIKNGAPRRRVARGTGPTKENARDAALAVATDPEVRRVLINYVPDQ